MAATLFGTIGIREVNPLEPHVNVTAVKDALVGVSLLCAFSLLAAALLILIADYVTQSAAIIQS